MRAVLEFAVPYHGSEDFQNLSESLRLEPSEPELNPADNSPWQLGYYRHTG